MAKAPNSAYADMLAQRKAAPTVAQPTMPASGAAQAEKNTYISNTAQIADSDARLRAFSTTSPNYVPPVVKKEPDPVIVKEDTLQQPPKDSGYTTGQDGELLFNGKPFTGKYNGITFINGWNQDIYDENGKERTKVKPGPTGLESGSTRSLAKDTFKNTLALFFGVKEMSQPWADALYNSVKEFYNSGSTIDESLNLSLQDVRTNPALKPFTDRFKGIYALQDRLVKGEAIEVPTIAEYFKSESDMGNVLRQAGMGDLATQDFLGGVLGLGKSVLEVTNLINDTFNSIDNAPAALKKDLESYLNLGVTRTDIAKALLTGAEGAKALNKKIEGISTLSAAKSQNVTIDMATAADIAARGYDYNKSLAGFADVKRLERGQMLGMMSGIGFTQKDAIAAQFESNYAAQDKIAKIGEEEINRFSGRSGRLNSQSRAQGLI
jgi:hypothetical protein